MFKLFDFRCNVWTKFPRHTCCGVNLLYIHFCRWSCFPCLFCSVLEIMPLTIKKWHRCRIANISSCDQDFQYKHQKKFALMKHKVWLIYCYIDCSLISVLLFELFVLQITSTHGNKSKTWHTQCYYLIIKTNAKFKSSKLSEKPSTTILDP